MLLVQLFSPSVSCSILSSLTCGYTSSDGTSFDFSPLHTPNGITLQGEDDSTYYVNICGVASVDSDCANANGTICVLSNDGATFGVLGSSDTQPIFSLQSPTGSTQDGVLATFINGDYKSQTPITYVLFVCDLTATQPIYRVSILSSSQLMWMLTISAASNCPVQPPLSNCSYTTNNAHFDFTSLITTNGTSIVGTQSDVYNVNPCVPVDSPASCQSSNAVVCFQFTWSPDWFAIATNNSPAPVWSLINEEDPTQGAIAKYNNGRYGPDPATVQFTFKCDVNQASPIWSAVHSQNYEWIITVTARACCPTTSQYVMEE